MRLQMLASFLLALVIVTGGFLRADAHNLRGSGGKVHCDIARAECDGNKLFIKDDVARIERVNLCQTNSHIRSTDVERPKRKSPAKDTAIDSPLNNFAKPNKDNPNATDALEGAAKSLKSQRNVGAGVRGTDGPARTKQH